MVDALAAITEYNGIHDEFAIEVIRSRSESVESFSEAYSAQEIRDRIERADRIFVHTDYDADGVMSAAIARLYLPSAVIYTPERVDGYGVSSEFVRGLDAGDLLITADCGIRSGPEISEAANGVDVIITDHHVPHTPLLPSCTVINPLLYENAFHGYSGASVIMLVLQSVYGDIPDATQYAAVGAVCDIMPMVGPNRKIVRDGIRLISSSPTSPMLALCKASGVYYKTITPEDIGWRIGPAINAAGRMGDAQSAIDLFCNTSEFDTLSQLLVQYNQERKRAVSEIVSSITPENTLLDVSYASAVLLDEVPAGFVGLVAGSIARETQKTSIVMTGDSLLSGSLRAYGDANCIEMLNVCSEYLERYGGHRGAAGFSVKRQNVDSMLDAIANTTASEKPLSRDKKSESRVPIRLSVQEAASIAYDLDEYEPFGNGFERPRFSSLAQLHSIKPIGSDKSHSSFMIDDIRCVMFGVYADTLVPGKTYEVLFTPKVNRFRGNESVQLEVYHLKETE